MKDELSGQRRARAMLKDQGGVCHICHMPPERGKLHFSQNYETREVRVICCICNHFVEDPQRLFDRIAYLRRTQPDHPALAYVTDALIERLQQSLARRGIKVSLHG